MTTTSDSLSPPRTFSQDAFLNDSVITHRSMLDVSPDDTVAHVETKMCEPKFVREVHATHGAFHETNTSDDIVHSKKPFVKPLGMGESCKVSHPDEISKRKGVNGKHHHKEQCANDPTIGNQDLATKGSPTSDVSITSMQNNFCLKSEKSSKESTESCDSLQNRIEEFLCFLIEKPILKRLGWPNTHLSDLLEAVIRHCGCSPSESHFDSLADKLRENCKVLFTKVLEDDVAGKLLDDDETVDAVLDKVLELARLS